MSNPSRHLQWILIPLPVSVRHAKNLHGKHRHHRAKASPAVGKAISILQAMRRMSFRLPELGQCGAEGVGSYIVTMSKSWPSIDPAPISIIVNNVSVCEQPWQLIQQRGFGGE